MKQSQAFHKGIQRVWSRLSAGSGTSRQDIFMFQTPFELKLYMGKPITIWSDI